MQSQRRHRSGIRLMRHIRRSTGVIFPVKRQVPAVSGNEMKRFVFIISFPTIMNFVMISKKTKADDSAFAIHGSNQRAKQNLLLNDGIIAAGSAETDFPDQCFQNRSFQFPAVFERADGSQRVPQLQERLRECLWCKFLLKIFREDLFQQFIIFFLKGSQRGISALKRGAPVMFPRRKRDFFLVPPGFEHTRQQRRPLSEAPPEIGQFG